MAITARRTVALLVAVLALSSAGLAQTPVSLVHVVIETSEGDIEVALDAARAPATVANFLRYVDAGLYDAGRFHRAVRLDNQVRDDVRIEVIQGARKAGTQGFGAIPLERTRDTGLRHGDGTISMARGAAADSAVSDFFLCIGPQPSLDFAGARAADGQGFAAFGRVVRGMDVVRRIQAMPAPREVLATPVAIVSVRRK